MYIILEIQYSVVYWDHATNACTQVILLTGTRGAASTVAQDYPPLCLVVESWYRIGSCQMVVGILDIDPIDHDQKALAGNILAQSAYLGNFPYTFQMQTLHSYYYCSLKM